jgi:hypothetical protein
MHPQTPLTLARVRRGRGVNVRLVPAVAVALLHGVEAESAAGALRAVAPIPIRIAAACHTGARLAVGIEAPKGACGADAFARTRGQATLGRGGQGGAGRSVGQRACRACRQAGGTRIQEATEQETMLKVLAPCGPRPRRPLPCRPCFPRRLIPPSAQTLQSSPDTKCTSPEQFHNQDWGRRTGRCPTPRRAWRAGARRAASGALPRGRCRLCGRAMMSRRSGAGGTRRGHEARAWGLSFGLGTCCKNRCVGPWPFPDAPGS